MVALIQNDVKSFRPKITPISKLETQGFRGGLSAILSLVNKVTDKTPEKLYNGNTSAKQANKRYEITKKTVGSVEIRISQ
jgi:hypothetical protein